MNNCLNKSHRNQNLRSHKSARSKKKLLCGTRNQHCLLLADYKVLHLIFTRTGVGSICIIFELDSFFCHASSAIDELRLAAVDYI